MKQISKKELLDKRMKTASDKLKRLAKRKLPKTQKYSICGTIGGSLGITSQSVLNYIEGKGSNGYITEILIEEFEKLPDTKKTKTDDTQ